MKPNKTVNGASFLLSSAAAWCLTATVSLIAAASILTAVHAGAAVIAYVSSALSFLCATAAGIVGVKKGGGGGVVCGLWIGVALSVGLLTVGFMVRGNDIEPGAVISVVSFTLSGALFGSVILSGAAQKRRRSARSVKPSVRLRA